MTDPAPHDVETFSNRGQWVTRVVDAPELSGSFSSRDEAVEAGERLAERLGTRHRVIESEPEGSITDEQQETDGAAPRTFDDSGQPAGSGALPPTTDVDGMPLDNPSG